MGRGPHAGGRMDGQMTFSSGWEWGYWLSDVVAAEAAWDPRTGAAANASAARSPPPSSLTLNCRRTLSAAPRIAVAIAVTVCPA